MNSQPEYPEFEEWFNRVGMLAEKLYNMEKDDLPFDFFFQEFEYKDSTPRQALANFENDYL
jgi:hypothetical protein